MSDTLSISDVYSLSSVPLPKLPQLAKPSTWDAVFTHSSLPSSNLVLAALGRSILVACITEWLMDNDPQVTQTELEVRHSSVSSFIHSFIYFCRLV